MFETIKTRGKLFLAVENAIILRQASWPAHLQCRADLSWAGLADLLAQAGCDRDHFVEWLRCAEKRWKELTPDT